MFEVLGTKIYSAHMNIPDNIQSIHKTVWTLELMPFSMKGFNQHCLSVFNCVVLLSGELGSILEFCIGQQYVIIITCFIEYKMRLILFKRKNQIQKSEV